MGVELILGTAQLTERYGVHQRGMIDGFVEAAEFIRVAVGLGFSALDTAPSYGTSESVIGQSGVGVKVYTKVSPGSAVGESVQGSLQRLRRSRLDVVYFHDSRVLLDRPEDLRELDGIRGEVVNYVGISLYELEEAKATLDEPKVDVVQVPANVLDRRFVGDATRAFRKRQQRVIFRSVFLQGLLTMPIEMLPREFGPLEPILRPLDRLSLKTGVSKARLCLGWLVARGQPDGLIVGANNVLDLEEIATVLNGDPVAEEILQEIDNFPQPSWEDIDPRRWRM